MENNFSSFLNGRYWFKFKFKQSAHCKQGSTSYSNRETGALSSLDVYISKRWLSSPRQRHSQVTKLTKCQSSLQKHLYPFQREEKVHTITSFLKEKRKSIELQVFSSKGSKKKRGGKSFPLLSTGRTERLIFNSYLSLHYHLRVKNKTPRKHNFYCKKHSTPYHLPSLNKAWIKDSTIERAKGPTSKLKKTC